MPDIQVAVYGRRGCVACRHVKRFLTMSEIEFVEKDVDVHQEFVTSKVNELGLAEALPFVQVDVDGESLFVTGNHAADLESIAFLAREAKVAS